MAAQTRSAYRDPTADRAIGNVMRGRSTERDTDLLRGLNNVHAAGCRCLMCRIATARPDGGAA